MASYKEKIAIFRSAVSSQPPWCGGVVPLPPDHSILYHGKPQGALGRIDFQNPTEAQLQALAQSCDAATFGVDQQNVLDETYRKAGKLDTQHFSATFDPEKLGLIQRLSDALLDGDDATKSTIRVERYKLNVYDQGAFFKPHKDTPRGEKMFGSLVVVLPTLHEGGALVLRDRGSEEVFDSAKMLSDHQGPSIVFTAFFSDVEHEVLEVVSGHRVTLTYNLYFEPKAAQDNIGAAVLRNQSALYRGLQDLLDDASFLPNGGYLGFGLHRDYPIQNGTKVNLKGLLDCLKGSDAAILAACKTLSLACTPYLLFQDDYEFETSTDALEISVNILCPFKPDIDSVMDSSVLEELLYYKGSRLINIPKEALTDDWFDRNQRRSKIWEVKWIIPPSRYCTVTTGYGAYGNEPSIAYLYSPACLVVPVGPAGKRQEPPPEEYDPGSEDEED